MREFEFIDEIIARNALLPASVLVPPGDDMAMVKLPASCGGRLRLVIGSARLAKAESSLADALRALEGCAPRASVVGVVAAADAPDSLVRGGAETLRARGAACGAPVVGGDFATLDGGCASSDIAGGLVATAVLGCCDGCACDAEAVEARDAPDGEVLLACDAAIEGRHAPPGIDPAVLARKAVLRNLSDVAAMGNARAVALAATVILAADDDPTAADRIEAGLRACGASWGAVCTSLDLHRVARGSFPTTIVVAVLATKLVAGRSVACRGDARAGDGVFVTGSIGGAWDPRTGLGRHLDFAPRIAEAHALSAMLGERLGAMIDVSDGLGRDLGHIARRSGCDLWIDLSRIPVPAGIDALAAIGHGEDYELALTARGEVPSAVGGVPLTRIGTVVPARGQPAVRVQHGSRIFDAGALGHEHGSTLR